jgi:hypothetical protein
MAHTPVTGYRELSKDELLLINKLKELENTVGKFLTLMVQQDGIDQRCLALGRTNLQQGFMWTIRSVAQPKSEL